MSKGRGTSARLKSPVPYSPAWVAGCYGVTVTDPCPPVRIGGVVTDCCDRRVPVNQAVPDGTLRVCAYGTGCDAVND